MSTVHVTCRFHLREHIENIKEYWLSVYPNGGIPVFAKCRRRYEDTYDSEFNLPISDSIYEWAVCLYIVTQDEHIPLSCTPFCNTIVYILDGLPYSMKDINDETQADLNISVDPETFVFKLRPKNSVVTSKALIALDSNIYNNLREYNRSTQVFYSIKTIYNDFPLVALPLLSTMIRVDDNGLQWIENQVKIAYELNAIDFEHIDKYSTETKLNVIGSALTHYFGALTFVNDFVFDRFGHRQLSEQWSMLLQNPRLDLAGYDCEDGTLLVISMAYALMTYTFTKQSPVYPLAQLFRQYTIGSVQCEIRNDDDTYAGHSIALAIDTRIVDRWINKSMPLLSYLPVLVLETTSWQRTVWSNHDQESASTLQSAIDHSELLRDIIRIETPSFDLPLDTYGRITKIQFPSYKRTALSLAIYGSDNYSLDASFEKFVRNPSEFQVEVISQVESDELAILKSELQRFPVCQFPSPPLKKKKEENDEKISHDDLLMQCRSTLWNDTINDELTKITSSKYSLSSKIITVSTGVEYRLIIASKKS